MSAYDGQTDEQLMELAKKTMFAAAEEEPGSVERAMKFAAYDSITNELKSRIVAHAVRELNAKLGLPDL